MKPSPTKRSTVLASIVLLAVLVVVVAALVSGRFGSKPQSAEAAPHPAIAAGQACTSCKAPQHEYKHLKPYTGPCESCHTTSSWRRIHYTHRNTDFDASMHAVLGCAYCHTEGKASPSPACEKCHASKSPHGKLPLACASCHSPIAWGVPRPVPEAHLSLKGGHQGLSCFDCHDRARKAASPGRRCVDCHGENHGGLRNCEECHTPDNGWRPKADFNHSSFFMLKGKHARIDCAECHRGGRFAGTPRNCAGCHGTHHGGLANCQDCHSPENGWEPLDGFKHSAFFELVGVHAEIDCTGCHSNGVFAGTPRSCLGCHGVEHTGLPTCADCHTAAGGTTFSHSAFRLTGKHTAVACAKCHPNGAYEGRPRTCTGCHGTRHGGLTACQDCHTTRGFRPSTFVHSTFFSLRGAHAKLACTACHGKSRYATALPTYCSGCHGTKHGGLSACQDCHTTSSFTPSTFRHSSVFALRGVHAELACSKCHPRNAYGRATAITCSGCHGTKHGGLSACQDCHTTASFTPSTFRHSSVFALRGVHAELACSKCHPRNAYATNIGGGGTACANCHTAPHEAQYSSCATCHTTSGWAPTKAIAHPGTTITLGSAHTSRSCRLCHPTLRFLEPTKPCEQCHLADCVHVGPTDCIRCHRPTQWSEVHFTHPDLGIHANNNVNQQCLWCHPGPDFTKFDCKTCHVDGGIPWYDPTQPARWYSKHR